METILIAEDEVEVRNYLGTALRCHGFAVDFAQNGDEALECIRAPHNKISLLLLDLVMPCKDGLQALQEIRGARPDLPVIMLSGASSPVNIVSAMKNGAADFLAKPVDHQDLYRAIQKAFHSAERRLRVANPLTIEFQAPVTGRWTQKIEALLNKVGSSDVPVLLQGETGVGKEVLARKLHNHSTRAGKPFLKLNCAALPSELVESELFGYERGAFTGAFKNTPGKFEMANGGTILLDEIGDMDFRLQAKLLQVLQDHEFLRLGSKEISKVDVRVMAATHCDLQKAIAEGRFREDLYYRLSVVDIQIPPLRERTDEIPGLAEYFLCVHATPNHPRIEIPAVLRHALLQHGWPGNIRELENVMRKFLVLRNAEALAIDLRERSKRAGGAGQALSIAVDEGLESAAGGGSARSDRNVTPAAEADRPHLPRPDPSILSEVDTAYKAAEVSAIVQALNACRWNRKRAAALLNIDYKALLYKMKKLGIGEKTSTATA